MSPKFPHLSAGLTALGLAWFGATAFADEPPRPPADPAPSAAPAPPKPQASVLLLTNGKVLQGLVLEDDSSFVLKHKVGIIKFPRREVVKAFASLEEAYQHKLALTPQNDPDERLKLAAWCLEQHLTDQAREQLRAVLDLSPDNKRAKAMMANLTAIAGRAAARDQAVLRAQAQGPAPGEDARADVPTEDGAPPTLNPDALRNARRYPKPVGAPVILDLPPALAVRRYQEFSQVVHPVLQRYCARCHNEQSQSDFQLVLARSRRDLADEMVVRANLDATLRLVEPTDLAHSPLLSASGMTHRRGRPVLGGPNHPDYRQLSAWVNALQVATPAGAPGASPPAIGGTSPPADGPPSEGFAAGRSTPQPPNAMPVIPPAPPGRAVGLEVDPYGVPTGYRKNAAANNTADINGQSFPAIPQAPGRFLPGSYNGPPLQSPPNEDFRTPPLLGGPNPAPIQFNRRNPVATGGAPGNAPDPATDSDPNAPKTMRLPNGEVVPVIDAKATLKADPNKGAKKPKISTNALDSYMKNRAAPR